MDGQVAAPALQAIFDSGLAHSAENLAARLILFRTSLAYLPTDAFEAVVQVLGAEPTQVSDSTGEATTYYTL